MRLDIDCLRDIMLKVEDLPLAQYITIQDLSEQMPWYSTDLIQYNVIQLHEAGYLHTSINNVVNAHKQSLILIYSLTFQGHQFLDNIRDESVFSETKKTMLGTVKSTSINIISQIASSILQHKLGL